MPDWLKRIPGPVRGLVTLVQRTLVAFIDDQAMRLGAALAFYTALSVAPLLILMVAVAGWIWGDAEAQRELFRQLNSVVGPDAASSIRTAVAYTSQVERSGLAAVGGIAALLFGATLAFAQLQDALNTIWDVEAKEGSSIGAFLRGRLLSLIMIIGFGVLLAASLAVSAAMSFVASHFVGGVPGPDGLWTLLNYGVSVVTFAVLFGIIYRVLPDARIAWRDVWVGALVTAVLFAIGKELIALYIGRAAVGSPFGAASSLMVLLVWIYYSSIILFFGAEFTKVNAERAGRAIEPSPNALPRPARALLRRTGKLVGGLSGAVPSQLRRNIDRGVDRLRGERDEDQRPEPPLPGCEDLCESLLDDPFLLALADGSLPVASFCHALVEDRRWLLALSDAAGSELIELHDLAHARATAAALRRCTVYELPLQEEYLGRYGFDRRVRDRIATSAVMTRHVEALQAAERADAAIIALATRQALLHWICRELTRRRDIDPDAPYCDWLAAYAAPSFEDARTLLEGDGEHAPAIRDIARDTLLCARELWDEAYRAGAPASRRREQAAPAPPAAGAVMLPHDDADRAARGKTTQPGT